MKDPTGFDRRQFLQLAGIGGGVVFASALVRGEARPREAAGGLAAWQAPPAAAADDFFFLQLSDTHWGYSGAANPEADSTLKRAVSTINALPVQPDFIVFTGDLTHTTDDGDLRRKRMGEFKSIVGELKTKNVKFLPGEHDASLDKGKAYAENFGELHYAFDHKGLHFVVLDNVSDPAGAVGDEQIAWLKSDLGKLDAQTPLVVLAHRPLFDLYPQWDWATRDGAKVVELLQTRKDVSVFYGHIHQEHHDTTGSILHHSARSLIFPLPAPGSVPKKAPVSWDPEHPGKGLGWRRIQPKASEASKRIAEIDWTRS
jgi:predicted phosphodiesterase